MTVSIAVENYLRLGFQTGGRARPAVDCWGLYRLIVGEITGCWLSEFEGHDEPMRIARTAAREAGAPSWVRVPPGEERALDAVLMTRLAGAGRGTLMAPIHVGCVVEPGRMIDIEATGGVKVRVFRTTTRLRAAPDVANRVRGIFRPAVLA